MGYKINCVARMIGYAAILTYPDIAGTSEGDLTVEEERPERFDASAGPEQEMIVSGV